MVKNCVLCGKNIGEKYGKLQGTMLKIKDENNKNQLFYVCSECQKEDEWIEKAKIKTV